MEMIEILVNVVSYLAVGYLGYQLGRWSALKVLAEFQNNLKKILQEVEVPEPVQEITVLNIEKDQDGFFAYAEKDGQFMANGATPENLIQRLIESYPTKSFQISLTDAKWTESELENLITAASKIYGQKGYSAKVQKVVD